MNDVDPARARCDQARVALQDLSMPTSERGFADCVQEILAALDDCDAARAEVERLRAENADMRAALGRLDNALAEMQSDCAALVHQTNAAGRAYSHVVARLSEVRAAATVTPPEGAK